MTDSTTADVTDEARKLGLWWSRLDDATKEILKHVDTSAHDQLAAGIEQALALEKRLTAVLGDAASDDWKFEQLDSVVTAVHQEQVDVSFVMVDNNEVTSDPAEPEVGEPFILSWSDKIMGGQGLPEGYVDHVMLGSELVATVNAPGGPADTSVPMQVRVPAVQQPGDYPLSIVTNANGSSDYDGTSAPPAGGVVGGGMITTLRIGGGGAGAGGRDAMQAASNLGGSLYYLQQAMGQGDMVEVGNQLSAVTQHSQLVFGASASSFAQHQSDASGRSWDQLQIGPAHLQELMAHVNAAYESMTNMSSGGETDVDAEQRILYVSETLLRHPAWDN